MNRIYSKLLFVISLLALSGCELTSVDYSFNQPSPLLDDYNFNHDFSDYNFNFDQEEVTIGEIYSNNSIVAEYQLIEEGFIPEEGVEERLEILGATEEFAGFDSYFIIRPPIIRFPTPVCPPKNTDCKGNDKPITLSDLSLSFYSEHPDAIDAVIETEEGTYAVLAGIEYNEEFKKATIQFEVVNPELAALPTYMFVNTIIKLNGEYVEEQLQAEIVEDTFN